MNTTEILSEFSASQNNTTNQSNVFKNNENTTSMSTESEFSSSNYYVIDKSLMDILLKIIVCGIMPPMCVFGIVGNIVALIILFRHKPTRSTTILLIAIAFADLAFIASTIINVVSLIIKSFYAEHTKEVSMTLIIPFSVYLSPLPGRISNWLVTLISLERLVAVTHPIKVKQICTKKLMLVLSIVIPLSIAILTSPKLWLYEVKEITLPDGNITKTITLGSIGRQKELSKVYYVISEALLRFVPMGLSVVCNVIIIAVTFIQAKWRYQKQNYRVGQQPPREEMQITRTLLAITCVFIICLLPSTISRLMILFDPNSSHVNYSSNVHTLLTLIGLITESFNSSINFVIYVTMNNAYRRQLYLICGKKLEKKICTVHRTTTVSTSSLFKGHNLSTDVPTTDLSTAEESGDVHI